MTHFQGKQQKFIQIVKQLVPLSKRTSAILAAGLGLSVLVPVYAAFSASTNQNQLISQGGKNVEITLVSYAVTKVAYDKIIPQFVAKWKREKELNLVIRESYGGSGSQARAVIDGLDADIVALALAQDVTKIQSAGLIKPGWESKAPNNAIVTHSVVALETRDGNPKKIQTWGDLAKPGVQVITANPKTSGGARWNFLALWGFIKDRQEWTALY